MREKPIRKLSFAVIILTLLVNGGLAPAQTPAPRPAQTPADVERRVESILKRLTLEEKIDLWGGVYDFFVRGYSQY